MIDFDRAKDLFRNHHESDLLDLFDPVPCGSCMECNLKWSKEWMIRTCVEAKNYEHNYFLTLTYSDEFLPYGSTPVASTGELLPSLRFDDVSAFMKRLRFEFGEGIRFLACSEYGGKTQRPHYHICLLNMPELKDLVFYKLSRGGFPIYNSASIQALWSSDRRSSGDPFGFVTVQDLTPECCAYVARYCVKKLPTKYGKELEYNGLRERERLRMSRRPGLGRDFYEENKSKIYEEDAMHFFLGREFDLKPVRYYDTLFDVDDHEAMRAVKAMREGFRPTANADELPPSSFFDECIHREISNTNKYQKIKKRAEL